MANRKRKEYDMSGKSIGATDSILADAYEQHGGPLQAWGHLAKKTGKGAKKAIKKGGRAVADYFTNKLSKRRQNK